jgi:hypothetical protein
VNTALLIACLALAAVFAAGTWWTGDSRRPTEGLGSVRVVSIAGLEMADG